MILEIAQSMKCPPGRCLELHLAGHGLVSPDGITHPEGRKAPIARRGGGAAAARGTGGLK